MPEIHSKLPDVGTTIFAVMSKMAKDYDAINLSQGFPNFPVDNQLINIYKDVLAGNYHQYRPMPGVSRLLQGISDKIKLHYDRTVHPETELLITAGATQAIFTIIQTVIHQDDEAIILDPAYDCYDPAVRVAGGQPVHVNMNPDFSINWNKVEEAVTDNTKLLVFNNPHNPGGKTYTEADLEAIEEIMQRHPLLFLLADEVYEYVYFEHTHVSVNTRPALRNRAFIVSSFGKTFHITGWKIGYTTAPESLMREVKKIHQFNVFCVNSTAQETLARYLPNTNLNNLSPFYKKKRGLFQAQMAKSRFELLDCQGTYFQVARYSNISSKGDIDFAKELTQKHGVAAIPVSGFNKDGHDDHLIRFCFAKNKDTILKATEKLCKI